MITRRKIRYFAEYCLFLSFVFVIRVLPVRLAFAIADAVAWIMVHLVPRRLSRYEVAKENLKQVFGDSKNDTEIDAIIHGMWRHLFRLVCEVIQLPKFLRLENCGNYLDFYRREDCVRALLAGRPVLMLGGHFGNWEVAVNTFGMFGFPMGVVARELDNPWLHAWFRRFRESTGNQLISKSGGGTEIADTLERGGMISLLCDQDAGKSGIFVDFFGKPASTFKSIGLLALQYNALIIVGGAWRLPSKEQTSTDWVRFNLTTEEILDAKNFQGPNGLQELTQEFTSALERLILKAPEQYFWVHRRWKTPADARRKRKTSAA
jgi:KDO2-lipid IV(A) lauroyltransferase